MFLSVITKNLNWEISTKSLVTLRRRDGVKDGKINILGVSCLKSGGIWIVCKLKRGLGKKEGVDVFEVRLRPQRTL